MGLNNHRNCDRTNDTMKAMMTNRCQLLTRTVLESAHKLQCVGVGTSHTLSVFDEVHTHALRS